MIKHYECPWIAPALHLLMKKTARITRIQVPEESKTKYVLDINMVEVKTRFSSKQFNK